MKKSSLILSSVVAMTLFAGCGNDSQSKDVTDPIEVLQQTLNATPIATFESFDINRDSRYDGQLTATALMEIR